MHFSHALFAEKNLEGDIVVADMKELEMDASKFHARRFNAKEVLTPKEVETSFPIVDGTVKIIGREQRLRTSTSIQNKKFFKSQMNYMLQPYFKKIQRGMMRKLKVTSGVLQENSFIVTTLNPESNCTCRKKNDFCKEYISSYRKYTTKMAT